MNTEPEIETDPEGWTEEEARRSESSSLARQAAKPASSMTQAEIIAAWVHGLSPWDYLETRADADDGRDHKTLLDELPTRPWPIPSQVWGDLLNYSGVGGCNPDPDEVAFVRRVLHECGGNAYDTEGF